MLYVYAMWKICIHSVILYFEAYFKAKTNTYTSSVIKYTLESSCKATDTAL